MVVGLCVKVARYLCSGFWVARLLWRWLLWGLVILFLLFFI